ncbi:MAG: hypothetical protein ACK5SX_15040 [Sandaracinobacter sp.]
MPVEIRTSDGRHWARPVQQNQPRPPMIRFESPFERRRRRVRSALQLCFLFAFAVLAAAFFLSGKVLP